MNIIYVNNICKYFQNIYCMCVYLNIHNKYTQHTHKYYVNKNFYFGCDESFDSTNIYSIYIYYSLVLIFDKLHGKH